MTVSTSTSPVVLGLDLGTTQVKAGIFEPDGGMVAAASTTHPPTTRRLTVGEQDPDTWWSALRTVIHRTLEQAGGREVVAIGCVGQGPTLVAVDERHNPVRPAICWSDSRSSEEQVELGQKLGKDGFLLGTLPKILWMQRNEPELVADARWFLTSWDFVTLRLTGVPWTALTPSRSETTPDLADAAGLDPETIPPTIPWGEEQGTLQPEIADELGLSADVIVVGGSNDAAGSYVGTGLLEAGHAINTGGTSGGFAVYADESVEIPGAYSIPAVVPGLRLFGGAMSATGKSLDWLQQNVMVGRVEMDDLLRGAAELPPGAEGLVFLPYISGERSPLWDPNARGAFVGLDASHGASHLTRAVLEAAAYAIRHVAEPIVAGGAKATEMRTCGGSARSELWNQIKADVTGLPVAVPAVIEAGTLGAGILAALGAGLHSDISEGMRRMVHFERRIEPHPGNRDVYQEMYEVYRGLYPDLVASFTRLGVVRRGEIG